MGAACAARRWGQAASGYAALALALAAVVLHRRDA
jgi:hypothetical protein